jgi:hypothetical protein
VPQERPAVRGRSCCRLGIDTKASLWPQRKIPRRWRGWRLEAQYAARYSLCEALQSEVWLSSERDL